MAVRIITEAAEKQVLERVNDLFFEDLHQRCIFLKFSQIENLKDDWKDTVVLALRELILDDNSEIYFCHDRDAFIINRSFSYRKFEQFLAHLDQKLAPVSMKGQAQIFEIGVDMNRIRKICSSKIEAIAAEKEKKTFKEPVRRQEHAEITIDPQLASTVSQRRRSRKSIEILVVEDDPFSQKLVQNTLSKHASVTITGDGQGALMNYVMVAPDIIFLDIGLPDIDGHAVLKKIFSFDPEAFVVMFSGKGDRENIVKAVETGAKGFVGKPFTKEKLFQYIDKSPFVLDKTRERPAPWRM